MNSPNLNEALRLIDCLVIFASHKDDGEPVAKAMGFGLEEVHVTAKAFQALRVGTHTDNRQQSDACFMRHTLTGSTIH
ncbi:hypothetical protein ACV22V_31860 [Burkholderia sp. AW33-5]